MVHTRRQIDLETLWADILAGKYAGLNGPTRVFPGKDRESFGIPQVGYAEVYDRKIGGGWEPITQMGDNSVDELLARPLLRSAEARWPVSGGITFSAAGDSSSRLLDAAGVYWDAGRDDILKSLKQAPDTLSRDDLVSLVRELDRRYIQLHDKVDFEHKNKLVGTNAVPVQWGQANPDIKAALKLPPDLLSQEDLIHLLRELDRSFMQLHGKVTYERLKALVDYSKLQTAS